MQNIILYLEKFKKDLLRLLRKNVKKSAKITSLNFRQLFEINNRKEFISITCLVIVV